MFLHKNAAFYAPLYFYLNGLPFNHFFHILTKKILLTTKG